MNWYRIKGNIKSLFLNFFNMSLTKSIDLHDFIRLIKILEESYVKVPLIRVGEGCDGGYVVPDIIQDCDVLFSPGVAENYGFELEVWKRFGIHSHMIDASVSGPIGQDFLTFRPLFLKAESIANTSITLKDWLIESGEFDADSRKVLQMDIEGGEFEVLTEVSSEVLRKFDIVIIEFHFLTDLLSRNGLIHFKGILNKLLKDFYICHLHGNNVDRVASLKGIDYPECIEISFIRKDLVVNPEQNNFKVLPNSLDYPNDPNRKEIMLGKLWGNIGN